MPNNQRLLVDIGQGLALTVGLPKVVSWNSAERPKKPKTGTFGLNKQTNSLEVWNGKDWLAASMDV